MNLQLPASNISQQWHPCPNCKSSILVNVITRIETTEDFNHFMIHRLNRAQCTFCGSPVEAPVRVSLKMGGDPLPDHECVPLVLLESQEVLDDLLRTTPPGLIRVWSNDELARSVEAHLRLEFRRQGVTPEEFMAQSDR